MYFSGCRSLRLDPRVYVEIKILHVGALMSATWGWKQGDHPFKEVFTKTWVNTSVGHYLSLNLPNPSQTDLRLKQLLRLHILSRVRQTE